MVPWRAIVVVAGVLAAPAVQTPQPAESSPCTLGEISQVAPIAATPAPASGALTIASLNIAGGSRIVDALTAWASIRSVDVLLLQEVGDDKRDGVESAASIATRLGFWSTYVPARPVDGGHHQGLAIVSRHPLEDVTVRMLPYNKLSFRSRCRIGIAATVHTSGGALRVLNVHLDTRINIERRVRQIEAALTALEGFTGARIVGGDFNTADIKWINSMWPLPFAQKQAEIVRARMLTAGFATPFVGTRETFPFVGMTMKLDWLYLSPDLDATDAGVDDVPLTDHRGIWTRAASNASRLDPTGARR